MSLNDLLDESLTIALHLIQRHGNHIPFAIGLSAENELMKFVVDDSDESMTPDLRLEELLVTIGEQCKTRTCVAMALAQNVDYISAQDGRRVDAIQVDLDNHENRAVRCFLPYTLDQDGVVIPGEVFAVDAGRRFF